MPYCDENYYEKEHYVLPLELIETEKIKYVIIRNLQCNFIAHMLDMCSRKSIQAQEEWSYFERG